MDHFLAGGISGFASCVALQPMDVIKTRQQEQKSSIRKILRTIGPPAQLWRGTGPTILRNVPGSALYFCSLNSVQRALNQYSNFSQNWVNLIAGSSCRASIGVALMPISIVKTRFESRFYTYSSISSALVQILRKEGFKGLFYGWGATALRDAPFAGIYVVSYENCKQIINSTSYSQNGSVFVNSASGVVSGLIATTITHPFDMIKTRIQVLPGQYQNLFVTLGKVLQSEGVKSLFSGLIPRVTRKTLSSAITWTFYEEILKWSKAAVK